MNFFSCLCCVIIALCFSCQQAAGQVQRCHTMEYLEELKEKDPRITQRIEQARNLAAQYLNSRPAQKREQQTLITIPVVVHVLHRGDSVGVGINISDAQILSEFEVLNEDYQALNADLANVPSHFTSVIGNPELEFCLAKFDPAGNPTNGIDRVSMGPNGSWSDNLKPNSIWDASKYLNIWITEIGGGTLAYTTFPGTSLNYDGVVVDYRYFGKAPENSFPSNFDLGRTTTHEIGHWLGLDHTFQGGCSGTSASTCSTQGDNICDTPPTANANYGCAFSTNRNTCQETPVDLPDMWMNYMDYMDDACMYMFSQEQVDEMLAVLNTSRAGILSSIPCNLFSYSGKVVDAQTGQGVANAKVFFAGTASYEAEADSSGNFTSLNFRSGTYAIYAGKWGYMTNEFSSNTRIDASSASFTIPIEKGSYYDDFILDCGWTTSGTASSGLWERGIPIETDYNGAVCNPGEDITGDFGDKCFVTGNGGGSAANDDVDEGNVILMSPLFDLTGYNEPYISYYRWFYNGGNQPNPNDQLVISISNGIQTQVLETIDAGTPNSNQWNFKNIRVKDFITPTDSMQLLLETADQPSNGHLVEAALDGFQAVDSLPTISAFAHPDDSQFFIYPNPACGFLNVEIKTPGNHTLLLLMDASGKIIQQQTLDAGSARAKIDVSGYPGGVYLVKLLSNRKSIIRKVTLIR